MWVAATRVAVFVELYALYTRGNCMNKGSFLVLRDYLDLNCESEIKL